MFKQNLSQLPHSLLDYLQEELATLSSSDSIHECGSDVITRLAIEPDAIITLSHQKLHVYPFSKVPTCWRRAYEEACLWQVVKMLKRASMGRGRMRVCVEARDWIDEVVRLCDMALIMTGGPGRRDCIMWMLQELEHGLVEKERGECDGNCGSGDREIDRPESQRKRMKLSLPAPKYSNPELLQHGDDDLEQTAKAYGHVSTTPMFTPPQTFPISSTPIPRIQHAIPRLDNPSLDVFRKQMHDQRGPIILAHTIDHWPALERWSDPRYWLRRTIGGRRLVPIELGRSYTDAGWGQKITRFGEFLENGLLRRDSAELDESSTEHVEDYEILDNTGDFDPVSDADTEDPTQVEAEDPAPGHAEEQNPHDELYEKKQKKNHKDNRQVYLAQHDLLTQIPALHNDIAIPDYCYLSPPTSVPQSNPDTDSSTHPPPPTEPLLNIWLGPASTISPCHTDPHHNILAQVFGRKYVRLFAPEETVRMYPMGMKHFEDEDDAKQNDEASAVEGINMSNTSLVDVSCFLDYNDANAETSVQQDQKQDEAKRENQLRQYPLFREARYIEGVLEPGECLYIPPGWWHYVQSLSVSCSVSFWWD